MKRNRIPESKILKVVARSPFEVYFEGEARVVSAKNAIGQFDILPGHADFFSLLNPGEVLVETDGEPVTFTITNGIVAVRSDEVKLFVNM
jgi:F0F1-type ATP synthase epsilon subunit